MGLDTAIFFVFLGCVAILHAHLPKRGRVALLLCASLFFYALSSPSYLLLMFALCGINYAAVLGMKAKKYKHRRAWLFAGAVVANLAVLIAFKYVSPFLGGAAKADAGAKVLRWAVPLGLSYFVFQMISCVTDAYREVWKAEEGFSRFALFSFFFPQITSGPIPRAGRLLPQFPAIATPEDRLAGIRMIAYGLFKKYVVANRLGLYVGKIFEEPSTTNSMPTLLAVCFNVLQIYADFSGYMDIAIGSARFLGIRLDPNFDRPFVSTSVTDFWRRWHMTLSFWLRDYLYMPLVMRIRTLGRFGIALALIFTFAICGIWHAATWCFLLFGLTQGIALTVESLTKTWRTKKLKRLSKRFVVLAGIFYTLSFFVLTQVLFRSATISQAGKIYSSLLHPHFSGGLNALLGIGPYFFAYDGLAIGLWIAIAFLCSRVTDRWTPWFTGLCGVLLLFLGRFGAENFIYATF